MVMLQILLNGAEPCDAGTTQLSSPVCTVVVNKSEALMLLPARSCLHQLLSSVVF